MSTALHARRLAVLACSAASGLVRAGDDLWMIADDIAALQRYSLQGAWRGHIPLAGDPSAIAPLAKRLKPDLEALVALPDGRLLALGSGSAPQREQGFLVDPAGPTVQRVDLAALYGALRQRFCALNIEGAAVCGEQLVLAQRGNSVHRENALVLLALAPVVQSLSQGRLPQSALRQIQPVVLGELEDAALSLTDLALHPDGALFFLAAAERTDNPYDDGHCHGSVIGRFDAQLRPAWRAPVRPALKLEGLCWLEERNGRDRWLLVADADDPGQPAPLLELTTAR